MFYETYEWGCGRGRGGCKVGRLDSVLVTIFVTLVPLTVSMCLSEVSLLGASSPPAETLLTGLDIVPELSLYCLRLFWLTLLLWSADFFVGTLIAVY